MANDALLQRIRWGAVKEADLEGADLEGADLRWAILGGESLEEGLVTAKLCVLAIYDQCQRSSDLRLRSG